MPQEFLASFAVDIDEGGVNRLEQILENNRELAGKLADAFDEARNAMEGFIRPLAEDMEGILPFPRPDAAGNTAGAGGSFPVGLDFAEAGKQLETFLTGAKKQLRLSADGSGIVSAVSSAISQARSMLAGANLKMVVKTETEKPDLNQDAGPVRYLSTGGRFSSPTKAEIAEDGETEYVIPVRKEKEAVPLIRSLLSELSASARATLLETAAPVPAGSGDRAVFPDAPLSMIPSMLSAASDAAAPQIVRNVTSNNVSAPVNIRVEASSADPEKIGKSIYDTAEHYLLRTLQGVNA